MLPAKQKPCDLCNGMVASPLAAAVVTAILRCELSSLCAARLSVVCDVWYVFPLSCIASLSFPISTFPLILCRSSFFPQHREEH